MDVANLNLVVAAFESFGTVEHVALAALVPRVEEEELRNILGYTQSFVDVFILVVSAAKNGELGSFATSRAKHPTTKRTKCKRTLESCIHDLDTLAVRA